VVTNHEKIDAYLEGLRLAKRPAGTISDKQPHLRLFTSLANKQALADYGRADVLRMKNYPDAEGYAAKTTDNAAWLVEALPFPPR
jgi:hypothetical protein